MRVKNTELKVIQADLTTLPVEAFVCPVGDPAFQNLGARKIISVVTKTAFGRTSEAILRRACRTAFSAAQKLGVTTLAIPALGSGASGFPETGSAKILAQETLKFLRGQETRIQEILFCLADAKSYAVFEKNLIGYVRHIEEDLGQGPYLTVDAIIELPRGVVVIERSNPPYGWALPGGFVDRGESLETAVRREMREETGLQLKGLTLFGVYSDPRRDPRFHTVSIIYRARGKGTPMAGDDAQGLRVVPYRDLLKLKYAFDHKKIISDYCRQRARRGTPKIF